MTFRLIVSMVLPTCDYWLLICVCVSADVEAFARAMQGSREESKEKKDEEDMSLD